METKANYVAVGAFVLACVIGLVVTMLWLAGAQYSQEYAYYQAYFKGSVTGLGKGTVTRYNGIDVGRITDLKFDPADPQRVIVTLQVQPNLNIREDSVASIDSQGLTGGSFVEIAGGTASSPLLDSSWDSSSRRRSSSATYASAPAPVTASMRRTPEATPASLTILNSPMSPVRLTWVPPQSSVEKSPIFNTRTSSPYFSPNNAIAPKPIASS